MARLINDPSDFAEEFMVGFVAAHPQLVRRVQGGIARAGATPPGHVAVVIGGGSGHYPAFAGLVGAGLAHGAAVGNIFASPSAQQIYSVAKSVEAGGGVLLSYGNYMGDVLNFNMAQERLRDEGICCETVVVTDDVASASDDDIGRRRGIAGDLFVFKTAGASADAGHSLDEVTAFAQLANDRTRSLGVAFSGLTLPGSSEPLFTVPEGRMAVGMGIHGEPGLLEVDLPSANELADLMTARLLGERPLGLDSGPGTRLAVVLNGLGSVKGEELFVLYGRVAKLLDDAGITIVMAEVGELVTSFEMAGVSLTFSWLDADLEQLWIAAAGAPAFRRGNALEGSSADVGTFTTTETVMGSNPATPASADLARDVLQCLQAMKTALDANVDHLGRLDAIAGDGDHGIGMQRGSTAAVQSAERAVVEGSGAGTTLARAADAWSDKAGGTSGLLWGILLRELGEEFGDVDVPDLSAIARGISSGHREITRFGKAQLGDKTMVDVLVPVADSLTRSAAGGLGLIDAVTAAADVAESSAAATADLMPLIGRARPHAEKSVGTPDPGATSLALLVRTLQRTLINRKRTA